MATVAQLEDNINGMKVILDEQLGMMRLRQDKYEENQDHVVKEIIAQQAVQIAAAEEAVLTAGRIQVFYNEAEASVREVNKRINELIADRSSGPRLDRTKEENWHLTRPRTWCQESSVARMKIGQNGKRT